MKAWDVSRTYYTLHWVWYEILVDRRMIIIPMTLIVE
jgi:hypothetical protein